MKKFYSLLGGLLIATAGATVANAESVYVEVNVWDNATQSYVPAAYGFDTELTKDAEGVYTMQQFFNSGYPASFTFPMPEVNGWSSITMAGNLDAQPGLLPYLLTPEGDSMTCYAYDLDGGPDDWQAIYWPYVDDQNGYSWVSRYDMTDPDNVYEFYGQICMSGTLVDNSYAPWYYLQFFFNEPETTGINTTIEETETPVIYYNLQGQRVANPTHGIYIRRQGNHSSKVLL